MVVHSAARFILATLVLGALGCGAQSRTRDPQVLMSRRVDDLDRLSQQVGMPASYVTGSRVVEQASEVDPAMGQLDPDPR